MTYIIEHCHLLNRLSIEHCSDITGPLLQAIGNSLPNLRRLSIEHDNSVASDALVSLIKSRGAGLTVLRICQPTLISNAAILAIAKHCTKLWKVILQDGNADPSAALVGLF